MDRWLALMSLLPEWLWHCSVLSVSSLVVLSLQLSTLVEGFLDATHHVERGLGEVVTLTIEELTEAINGVGELDESTLETGEDFGNTEWLGQESLDSSGSGDSHSVLFRQLVHTQNGNDILQGLVVLDQLLHTSCNVVVLVTNDSWVEHSRGRLQWVHSWVDTQFSNSTGKYRGGVHVSKRGGWGRVSKVISWHIDSLQQQNSC